MNPAKLTIPLMLLVAGLLAAVVWQARLLRELRPANDAPSNAATTGDMYSTASSSGSAVPNETHDAQARVPVAPNTPVATDKTAFDWRQVESEDYRTYVKNLRNIGCPEQTVRDIVAADVRQAYAAQRSNVAAAIYRDFNYWDTEPTEVSRRDELHKQRRELDEEMTRVLGQLLGDAIMAPDASREWQAAVLEQQLAFLPTEKREGVFNTLLRYVDNEAQMVALVEKRPPTSDPDELHRIWDTSETGHGELAGLLTPGEYDQLLMSVSWCARVVRGRLPDFHPSKEEFQMIFHEWWALDRELARIRALGLSDPGTLDKAVYPRLREQLGEQRYKEYVRIWDANKFRGP